MTLFGFTGGEWAIIVLIFILWQVPEYDPYTYYGPGE